jgi:hypothetical protein
MNLHRTVALTLVTAVLASSGVARAADDSAALVKKAAAILQAALDASDATAADPLLSKHAFLGNKTREALLAGMKRGARSQTQWPCTYAYSEPYFSGEMAFLKTTMNCKEAKETVNDMAKPPLAQESTELWLKEDGQWRRLTAIYCSLQFPK